jgi:type VI secretion system secreted protein Hcp
MAVDMFLKIEGVEGESKDAKHGKEIDVLAWSWGVSNAGTFHSGTGGGAGKANVQDLSLTKYYDKASPNLLLACCTGKHYDEALLTVRKAGENPLEYIKITMTNVLVTSVSTGGSGGEDRLTENVTLNFGKVKSQYWIQNPKGGGDKGPEMTYDIAANEAEK